MSPLNFSYKLAYLTNFSEKSEIVYFFQNTGGPLVSNLGLFEDILSTPSQNSQNIQLPVAEFLYIHYNDYMITKRQKNEMLQFVPG